MSFEELMANLEGLSEAQLRLILEVAWGELPAQKKALLVKLAEAMRKETPSPKT